MPASELKPVYIPEWYRTEREAGKIIERLGTVKELDFYLKNPDEYIRRLAILRLCKVTDKGAVPVLKELVDDPAESGQNKYLAAWILKSLSKKWAGDIYLSSRYLGDFTGNESFDELFNIKQGYSIPSAVLNFTSSPSYRAVKLDTDEGTYGKDTVFETEFDFKKWLSKTILKLLKTVLSGLCALPGLLIKLPLRFVRGAGASFRKLAQGHPEKSRSRSPEKSRSRSKEIKYRYKPEPGKQGSVSNDFSGLRNSLYKDLYKKPGFFTLVKKVLFQFLYYLFSPLRFARRHKLAVLCLLLITYSLLAYTDYGRSFTTKYMAVDFKELQDNTVEKVKEYSSYAVNEFSDFLGIGDWKRKDDPNQQYVVDTPGISDEYDTSFEEGKLYLVTAKSGLNIRKSPDASSERVGDESLAFGSLVTYLSKSKEDSSGRVWYYIKAKDGRAGWVSAMFLKEKKEG